MNASSHMGSKQKPLSTWKIKARLSRSGVSTLVCYWWTCMFPRSDITAAKVQCIRAWGWWDRKKQKSSKKGNVSKPSSGLKWQQEITVWTSESWKDFSPRGQALSNLSVFVLCVGSWVKMVKKFKKWLRSMLSRHWQVLLDWEAVLKRDI